MKITNNFRTRSRLAMAGLCGATALAFTTLSPERVEAQTGPQSSPSPVVETEKTDAQASPDASAQQTENQIDLSQVSFTGQVVQQLTDSAVIVRSSDRELLLPMGLVSLNESAAGETASSPAIDSDEDVATSGKLKNDAAPAERTNYVETDVASTNLWDGNDHSSDLENGNYTPIHDDADAAEVSKDKAKLRAGDDVTVKLTATDAQIVALENGVLTARSDDTVMQLPASVLKDDLTKDVQLSRHRQGEHEGENLTLQQAISQDQQLAFVDDLSASMPKDARVGVLVANLGDKMILATPATGGTIQLISIPQPMQAGEAVSVQPADDGEQLAMAPLDEANPLIEHSAIHLEGTLVSTSDHAYVLKSGDQKMLLPAEAQLNKVGDKDADGQDHADASLQPGSKVTAVLPAGQAEVLAVLDDMVVLDTGDGVAQLPMDTLRKATKDSEALAQDDDEPARDELASLDSLPEQQQFQGMVVGHEDSLIVANLAGDQTQLVRVPAGNDQEKLPEGSMVSVDPGSDRVEPLQKKGVDQASDMDASPSPAPAP
jgi:hypothetical protein